MSASSESPYVRIARLRKELVCHPLYAEVDRLQSMRTFMKYHVFAVWDFMSLLKALQRAVTCVEVPWVPAGNPKVRRFINEIVLGEESDEDGRQGFLSHFELYCEAMEQCGADLTPVRRFLEELQGGGGWQRALDEAGAPEYVVRFVGNTLEVALSGKAHAIAAAFFFGREDVIPDMFRALVAKVQRESAPELERFIYYVDRHVQLDGDHHGPLARQMVTMLCENNRAFHQEAVEVALRSLRSRVELWDGVLAEIRAAKQGRGADLPEGSAVLPNLVR
jgi:Protein of unknown function (DUF3050)